MFSSETEIVQAPAKVNLFLEVLGKRDNGYHEIRSVVAPVSIFDTLEIEVGGSKIEVEVEHEGLEAGQQMSACRVRDNLTFRAASILKKASGCDKGARIRLTKRIPVGGGLGGGSSDAAQVLKTLNSMWGTEYESGMLEKMAFELGSDVPAFIRGRVVRLEGMGEIVKNVAGAEEFGCGLWAVVANPGFQVCTGDIYARCMSSLTSLEGGYTNMCFALERSDADAVAGGLFNGLQETVFRKYPFIQMIAEHLAESGAKGALLCGSGSSVFGLAGSEIEAEKVRDGLLDRLGCRIWTKVARIMPDGVMVAHGPLEA